MSTGVMTTEEFRAYRDDWNSTVKTPWPERVAKLREQRGNACEHCNRTLKLDRRGRPNLEFAHVKTTSLNGRGRGQTQRFRDIVQHPDAYKLLCKDCHKTLGDPS